MLGLLVATDARWAREALADLPAVLRDHAHCEMKAASHALSLAARHPDDLAVVRRLTAIAQEELEHFDRVVTVLSDRGIPLGTPPVDAYAAELRARVAKLPRTAPPMVDRLLTCALIEARSCERFKLLLEQMPEGDLCAFYKELFVAEAKHYREFCDLAAHVGGEAASSARLAEIARVEAEVVRAQGASPPRAAIHG
ncbi:MAG TPA: tRNA isopentenyl-2-thiomethyl-A-37 hydroxylase MiaE [Polyangiaceae bacterium]|nr:tRNA isopentenyl-2-thiomethyl-A-37 hydroxylase MiaE [Polyangiaceae bacterium]